MKRRKQTMDNGTYRAKVLNNVFAKSQNKGTPSIKIKVETAFNLKDPNTPVVEHLYGDLYLSDKAYENSFNTLENAFGWAGDNLIELNDPDRLAGVEVDVVVENEEYDGKTNPKIKFFNKPGGGQIKQLDANDVDDFMSTISNKLKIHREKQKMNKRAEDPKNDLPI